jgi:L-ascorbate metabolism protein UlaG (beta-lactamase superfamily)
MSTPPVPASSGQPADDPSRAPLGSLTFVGNATVLLRLGRFTVLTDPNFIRKGQRAYLGKGLWTRRLRDPALSLGELPPLDLVVLSHLHGDHFDRVARRGLDRSVPLLTTPPAARRLGKQGFSTQALTTWQRERFESGGETLEVESLPGTHARGAMAGLLPPVMGTLLEHRVAGGPPTRVYLSGDTLTGDHLDEIARRHPEIDLALVHLGGTRVLLHTVTMDAAQGVDFLRRVRPRQAVPIHYDDYGVFASPLADFEDAARRAGLAERVRVVERGSTVPVTPAGEVPGR